MFDEIVEHNELIRAYRDSGDDKKRELVKGQRPVEATSMQRIRETLRTSLNSAIKQELITVNAAKLVELPPANRPKAKVWTVERVEHWKRTGHLPSPVMVWTAEQTGQFLDHALNDRLYPLFHLIAHRGLRRGEACGLRKIDTHLEARSIDVSNQIVQYGWETAMSTPKTPNSDAAVALDEDTVTVLADHLVRQRAAQRAAGDGWVDSGLVFTESDGGHCTRRT